MKKFKKLGALIMAFAMVLSLSVTALAVDAAKQVKITVNGISEKETVSAYKMVGYDEAYNELHFTQNGERSFLQYLIDTDADKKVTDEKTALEYLTGLGAAIPVDRIAAYVADVAPTGTHKYSLPTDDNVVSATSAENAKSVALTLDPGWYLLMVNPGANDDRSYVPTMIYVKATHAVSEVYVNGSDQVQKPGEDGNYALTVKSTDAVTFEKQVWDEDQNKWSNAASASVGDTLTFRVKVTLPDLSKVDEYKLHLEDTLENLEFLSTDEEGTVVAGSVKVYGETSDATWGDNEKGVPSTAVNDVATAAFDSTQKKLTIKLEISTLRKAQEDNSYSSVYVVYQAKLTADAAAYTGYDKATHAYQAKNSVSLTYGTPTNEKKLDPSITNIYTYSFDLTKIGENDANLNNKGAKFEIYNVDPTTEGAQPLEFVKVGEDADAYYRLALAGDTNKVTAIEANFKVQGLDNGTYYLKETETPSGYYVPADPVFVLKLDRNVATNQLANTSNLTNTDSNLVGDHNINNDKLYLYDITIKNSTHPQLPTTGGMGTVIFTVGGVALMGAAAVLFFATRKKKAEQ